MRTYDGFRFLIRKELNAARGCGIEKKRIRLFKMAMISLVEKYRVRAKSQNDYDILKSKISLFTLTSSADKHS